jgi:hypothetical protein
MPSKRQAVELRLGRIARTCPWGEQTPKTGAPRCKSSGKGGEMRMRIITQHTELMSLFSRGQGKANILNAKQKQCGVGKWGCQVDSDVCPPHPPCDMSDTPGNYISKFSQSQ